MLAQKLRDMHASAGEGCDPDFNQALLDAANKIDRLSDVLKGLDAVMDFGSPAETCACFPQGTDSLNIAMYRAHKALNDQ